MIKQIHKHLNLTVAYIGNNISDFIRERMEDIAAKTDFEGRLQIYDISHYLNDEKTAKFKESLEPFLKGVDFIIISMNHSDVTIAKRFSFLFDIANSIQVNCPKAWVINYTYPMNQCLEQLFNGYPKIKVLSCCPEVFDEKNLMDLMFQKCISMQAIADA